MNFLHKPTPAIIFNCVLSAAVLILLSTYVSHYDVSRLEHNLFRLINDLPDNIKPLLATIMQFGTYVSVLIFTAVALLRRKHNIALKLFVSGNLAYLLAFLCKKIVGRERPTFLIDNVAIRDNITGSLGYPSGHVAVATALCLVVSSYLPRKYRRYLWGVIFLVAVARIYVGAHLPIDVIGGFLVGWVAVSFQRLLTGDENPLNSVAYIRQVLRIQGLRLKSIRHLPSDARGSIPYSAKLADSDKQVFIKVTGEEQRDADWLYKSYRRLVYKNLEDELPYFTAKQKNEHEIYVMLLAERARANVPKIVTSVIDQRGNAFLIQQYLSGTTLSQCKKDVIKPKIITALWQQLALLHRADIAHRDLRGSNIFIVESKSVYFVDFGFSEANASELQKIRDIVELLVTTSNITNPYIAVSSAKKAFTNKVLANTLSYLQTDTLTRANRLNVKKKPELILELRRELISQTSALSVKPIKLKRIRFERVAFLIMLGVAVHVLLPQIGEAQKAIQYILNANYVWVFTAIVFSALTYLCSALLFKTISAHTSLKLATLLQSSSSFANRLAPGGLGSLGLSLRFLQKQGLTTIEASTTLGVLRLPGVISTILLLPLLLLYSPNIQIKPPAIDKLTVLIAVICTLTAISILLVIPKLKSLVAQIALEVRATLAYFRVHRQAGRLVLLSVALTTAYAACLYFSLLAVGVKPNFFHVLLVYIAGTAIGSAAPTPGGIGAVEAALTSALVVIGIPLELAVAAVLIYRMASFWLPILPGFFALQYLKRHEYI